ncbi:MAG: hypothetical protein WCL06_08910 [Bacteroidota bacterium]
MEKRLAQIIAILFHPLLMPTYSFLLLFNIDSYLSLQLVFKAKIILTFMIVTSTVVTPLIMFTILKRNRMIADFHMKTKEERIYPFISLTAIYFLLYLLVSRTALHPIYGFILLSTTMVSLAIFFINLRWKISVHTAGMGGLTAVVLGLSYRLQTDLFLLTGIIIICSGLVGFARLKTDSHKPSEIYSGYLVGATVFLLMFLLF